MAGKPVIFKKLLGVNKEQANRAKNSGIATPYKEI